MPDGPANTGLPPAMLPAPVLRGTVFLKGGTFTAKTALCNLPALLPFLFLFFFFFFFFFVFFLWPPRSYRIVRLLPMCPNYPCRGCSDNVTGFHRNTRRYFGYWSRRWWH
ncbi:unnamed protein product [Orchesella dallaii]|uniref:Uncharacterized protein n=1 Tax=Orchesella dallaii TaxID=48710 RepID=A0ABP1SB60_9HEXA